MKILLFILTLLLSPVLVTAEPVLSLKMHEQAWVEGQVVSIGDIAVVDARNSGLKAKVEAIQLKPAPRAGYQLSVSKEFVKRILNKHRFIREKDLHVSGPSQTLVKVRSTEVKPVEYLAKAEKYLYQHMTSNYTNVELQSVGIYKPVHVPVGEVEIKTSLETTGTIARRMPVMLSLYSDGKLYAKQPIWFMVKARAFAYKANQHIARNTEVTEQMIKRDIIDINLMNKNILSDAEHIVGRKALHDISFGEFVRDVHLHKKLDVVAGQEVEVFVQQGAIKLSLTALAVQGGSKGQKIKLRNKNSKEIFEGIVIDKNRVESI